MDLLKTTPLDGHQAWVTIPSRAAQMWIQSPIVSRNFKCDQMAGSAPNMHKISSFQAGVARILNFCCPTTDRTYHVPRLEYLNIRDPHRPTIYLVEPLTTCSASAGTYVVAGTRLWPAFVHGFSIWNYLPPHVRNSPNELSHPKVKTYLFQSF